MEQMEKVRVEVEVDIATSLHLQLAKEMEVMVVQESSLLLTQMRQLSHQFHQVQEQLLQILQ